MSTILATELIDRAAAAADMHDNFISTTQWYYWANKENLALAILIAQSGWVDNATTFQITPTGSEAGQYTLNLTAIPLAVMCVFESSARGTRMLKHNNYVDFLRQLPGTNVYPPGNSQEYRFIWDQDNDRLQMNLYPEPSVGTTYNIAYIPAPKKLVVSVFQPLTETLQVNYPLGWEERIVLGMAREALDKEESDTARIERKIAEMDSRIERECHGRVLSQVPTIRNSDNDLRGWGVKMSWPPSVSNYFWL